MIDPEVVKNFEYFASANYFMKNYQKLIPGFCIILIGAFFLLVYSQSPYLSEASVAYGWQRTLSSFFVLILFIPGVILIIIGVILVLKSVGVFRDASTVGSSLPPKICPECRFANKSDSEICTQCHSAL